MLQEFLLHLPHGAPGLDALARLIQRAATIETISRQGHVQGQGMQKLGDAQQEARAPLTPNHLTHLPSLCMALAAYLHWPYTT